MFRQLSYWLLVLCWSFLFPPCVYADWPMAGQNNQRTSLAPDSSPSTYNRGCGLHTFSAYIPTKTHVITVDLDNSASTTQDSYVLISAADGVYALRSIGLNNTSADIRWFYPTSQPVGHSVTVDKATQTVYIPSLDKTIHAVSLSTGQRKWQTLKAGGGFLTNPLVANNLVYAGNRDGKVYAFRTGDGSFAWAYAVTPNAPVDFSPAISTNNQVLYVASHNSKAYALNALTGAEIAVSTQFQGHGFYSFWPVVHPTANRVLFARSLNYPEMNYIDVDQTEFLKSKLASGAVPTTSTAVNLEWLTAHPYRQTLHVLNAQTLVEAETAPYLWWGNPNGNRYPPAIDPTGRVWAMSPWTFNTSVGFGRGRYLGWMIGESTFIPKPDLNNGHESHDEPEAIAIYGNSIWHGDGGDGWDRGGVASLSSSTYKDWWPPTLFPLIGNWFSAWPTFRYGNGLVMNANGYPDIVGTHGVQNPPVPLNGRVYIHRSNSLICLEP